MRGAAVGLVLALAAGAPAEALDLRAAEATVLGAQRTQFEPVIPEVRRPRRTRLDLANSEAFGTPVGWPADRLDLVISLLDGLDRESPLGRLGVTVRQVRNLLTLSENMRIRVRIDPLGEEYRAVVHVRF